MTKLDQLAAYFTARPNVWIDGLELAKIGGAHAWRTRLSECRRQLGMAIDNRERKLLNGPVRSEYRYVPAVEAVASAPHDLNGFGLR